MTRLVEIIERLAYWATSHNLDFEDIGVTLSFKNRHVMNHAQDAFQSETRAWELIDAGNELSYYRHEDFKYHGITVKFQHRELPRWEPPQHPRRPL